MLTLHLAVAVLNLFSAVVGTEEEPIQTAADGKDELPNAKDLGVKVHTTFPQAEIFGVKLVNGQATQAQLTFTNTEAHPINVAFIGGALWGPDAKTKGETSVIVRNLTSTRYHVPVPAGEEAILNYNFATELHPQELRLTIQSILTSDAGMIYTLNAFNETVHIVEPDASLFDPQLIFLYLMLLSLFSGSCYFIYNTWISTFFPQKRRGGKGGERAKKSSGGSKKVDPADQVAVVGADGPAVTSGARAYDESWIPQHHLQRPESKRSKSSSARPKTPKTP
ncbi:MAG: hypothetical protein GOMPHAMPRED_008138 [Gomphillus americanus]|uniref:Translocon-associated protein subunit alpha n=1 Tax=Gomphillus americanus TaxID=1940652 RepID=A0A8H3EVP1_9LECA|nr:MAG: hypothetical protein GOMPHAMPRED_008138 [Gomphillus americanus]